MRNGVAITGMGLICHQAETPDALWRRVLAPQSASDNIRYLEGSGTSIPMLPVLFGLEETLRTLQLRRVNSHDRALHLALFAATNAWKDSGMPLPTDSAADAPFSNAAVIVGTSRGPLEKMAALLHPSRTKSAPRLPSDSAFACLHGTLASTVNAHGPAFTVSTACASGAHAIALAADQIRCGRVPMALAGAAEAPLHPLLMRAMRETGILDAGALQPVCRPFAKNRSGTILGEGAAFLVLEDAAHAEHRGARIHGYLSGIGMAADGRIASPEAAGADALDHAVSRALEDAGVSPGDVEYINAHGTGTQINDAIECAWLKKFAASRSRAVPFGSTKAITGHCLGATPVLELIICLLAMKHGILPQSANCPDPMPEALPGLILENHLPWDGNSALSNAIGFWGSAASLLLQKT